MLKWQRHSRSLTDPYCSGLSNSYVSMFAHHSPISHTWPINTYWFYASDTTLPVGFTHNPNSSCRDLTEFHSPLPHLTIFVTSILQPLQRVKISSPPHSLCLSWGSSALRACRQWPHWPVTPKAVRFLLDHCSAYSALRSRQGSRVTQHRKTTLSPLSVALTTTTALGPLSLCSR